MYTYAQVYTYIEITQVIRRKSQLMCLMFSRGLKGSHKKVINLKAFVGNAFFLNPKNMCIYPFPLTLNRLFFSLAEYFAQL